MMVRDFARKEIAPHANEWDKTGIVPKDKIQKAYEMGLHTVGIPTEYGGMGLDTLTKCILREELGWADAGFAVLIGTNDLGFLPVELYGTEEQKKSFAAKLIPGAVSAFCLTEADTGSDALKKNTTATKVGDEYIINGVKTFITNGGNAVSYIVFATTAKDQGMKNLSAFIIDRDTPGVSVGKEEDKMGIRNSNTTDVIFDNVKIPAKNLIGKEGQGFRVAVDTLERTKFTGSSVAIGIAQRAIDESVKYAKERVVFGKPISKYQAISFMIADMEIQTNAARFLIYQNARLLDATGKSDASLSAAAKVMAGDVAMKVSTDAVQVLAGFGYSREYPVEKLMRDAKIYQIFEGTNQIQRLTIAGNLFR